MHHHKRALLAFAIAGPLLVHLTEHVVASEPTATANSANRGRTVSNFNRDWRFAKGDIDGAASPDFDDSAWQAVRLPHDWAIAGPFDPEEHGFAAKLPWKGVGWYRKTFTLDGPNDGRRVYLDFDGVMAFPQVYVNGKLAGGWDYGYMSFRVDATPYVKFGEPNVVAVRVDTTKHGTRWYPGAGIYRKVMLTVTGPIHIGHWGTQVTTPEITDEAARVVVRTIVENHGEDEVTVGVVFRFREPHGGVLGSSGDSITIPAGGSKEVGTEYTVLNPQRWDINQPNLYSVETAIVPADELSEKEIADANDIDRDAVKFGIRSYELTANDGFHLNGRRVQLHGVNLHHDHGPLGAAFYTRAMERQLEIMRDLGVNAIRTSHNPPSPELLDLCDRMGFVVWDECFDKWNHTAGRTGGKPPLKAYGEKQIRNLVMRDRNHPSVIVWSIANEIPPAPGDPEGLTAERVKFMSEFVRNYDPSRPVGLGHHIVETAATNIFDPLDFTGWNYGRRYWLFRERYPQKPIIYSESASALSTRGFYELPLPSSKTDFSEQGQVDSYDYNSARWSDIADVEFELMERDGFVAGEFVWTGFDYLGEPTPFDEDAVSSYFGIVDLCGLPKDRFYFYRSYWRPDVPTVHILPHWNWPDRVGQIVPVFVYTNGDSAELFLNGKSLGRREKAREVPEHASIVKGKRTAASSTRGKRFSAEQAADDQNWTRWRAAKNEPGQWWEIDLGDVHPVREVMISFDGQARDYQYDVKVSKDGNQWQTVAQQNEFVENLGDRLSHALDTDARFVRIEITKLRDASTTVGIRDVFVYPTSYYDVARKYRLQWMDVAYDPGELKAVAYKGGWPIGEAVMRTAGPPASIRLSPDRTTLTSSGEDLCYVTVEAVDADGTPCPLADNLVRFSVEGPAEIAAVGNGNPRSYESFQANERTLFYGKAILVLRTQEGNGGQIRVTAGSEGLTSAELQLVAGPES